MHHDGQLHFALSRNLTVLAQGFQRFTRQIAVIEQRQRQVFRQARVGGHGGKDFRRRIVHQLLQVGVRG